MGRPLGRCRATAGPLTVRTQAASIVAARQRSQQLGWGRQTSQSTPAPPATVASSSSSPVPPCSCRASWPACQPSVWPALLQIARHQGHRLPSGPCPVFPWILRQDRAPASWLQLAASLCLDSTASAEGGTNLKALVLHALWLVFPGGPVWQARCSRSLTMCMYAMVICTHAIFYLLSPSASACHGWEEGSSGNLERGRRVIMSDSEEPNMTARV
jgi:hypothetical protein